MGPPQSEGIPACSAPKSTRVLHRKATKTRLAAEFLPPASFARCGDSTHFAAESQTGPNPSSASICPCWQASVGPQHAPAHTTLAPTLWRHNILQPALVLLGCPHLRTTTAGKDACCQRLPPVTIHRSHGLRAWEMAQRPLTNLNCWGGGASAAPGSAQHLSCRKLRTLHLRVSRWLTLQNLTNCNGQTEKTHPCSVHK